MRTRLFLRTTEFLWQEGHTAHATEQEAQEETRQMLDIYAKFTEGWMAMPVVKGNKTESERFAGALDTLCIEAMMQDGKALQAGTSHFLGQNFARAFDVKFATKEGKQELVWATSWGVSTRLMGALVMTHSDDAGLVLPPKLAPIEVVIVPIYKGEEQMDEIVAKCKEIESELRGAGIRVKLDADDSKRSGWKFAEYELKGVPLRLAVGPRDLEKNSCELARRDTRTKSFESLDGIAENVKTLLETIQSDLFTSASDRLTSNTVEVDNWDDFKKAIKNSQFVMAHWDGTSETEDLISKETKASIRCLPFDGDLTPGLCIKTGNPSSRRVLFAKAY
jgi:prolyl-tRNA synthetase